MSRSVAVPDFGAGDGLWQDVQVAEPGEPGYPTPVLSWDDPWAPAVNQAIWEVEVAAGHRAGQDGLTSWPAREPEADPAGAGIEAG